MLNSLQESDQFFARQKNSAMLNSVQVTDQFCARANVLQCSTQRKKMIFFFLQEQTFCNAQLKVINSLLQQTFCNAQLKVINSLLQQTFCNAQLGAGKWSIVCTSKRFAMLNSVMESDQSILRTRKTFCNAQLSAGKWSILCTTKTYCNDQQSAGNWSILCTYTRLAMLNSAQESDHFLAPANILQCSTQNEKFFAPANVLQCSTRCRKVINCLHQQTFCNAQLSAGKWSILCTRKTFCNTQLGAGKWSILCTSKRFAMLNSVQESDQLFAPAKVWIVQLSAAKW